MWNWKVGNNYSHEIDTLLLKRHLRVSFFIPSFRRISERYTNVMRECAPYGYECVYL